jgi:hypothetical protein
MGPAGGAALWRGEPVSLSPTLRMRRPGRQPRLPEHPPPIELRDGCDVHHGGPTQQKHQVPEEVPDGVDGPVQVHVLRASARLLVVPVRKRLVDVLPDRLGLGCGLLEHGVECGGTDGIAAGASEAVQAPGRVACVAYQIGILARVVAPRDDMAVVAEPPRVASHHLSAAMAQLPLEVTMLDLRFDALQVGPRALQQRPPTQGGAGPFGLGHVARPWTMQSWATFRNSCIDPGCAPVPVAPSARDEVRSP